jgi:hypothetical protein
MRTLTKNRGFIAVSAVLLLSAILVTGCSNDIEKPDYRPPVGMGAVRLLFNENVSRATILPVGATINDFEQFILTFTANGGGAVTQMVTRLNTSAAVRNATIDLVPGNYDVTVVAYLIEDDTASAAATWSSASTLDISSGGISTLTITLEAYDPATSTGNGKFAWVITNSTGGTIQAGSKIALTTLVGGAVLGWTDVNLATPGNWNNSASPVTIPSGYYYVDITLIVNGTTREFRHVLHIYQNYTSTFSYTFTTDHIGVELWTLTPTINFTPPTDTGKVPVLTVAENASLNTLNGAGTAANPYILSLSDNGEPDDLTITVTNNATFSIITYYLNKASLGTGTTFSIDFSTAPFDAAPFDAAGGPYQITVEGIIGTTPYITEMYFTVID